MTARMLLFALLSACASQGGNAGLPELAPPTPELSALPIYAAAAQGNMSAQYNVFVALSQGDGVPKDERQATVWLHKSAEQGLPLAQGILGALYVTGELGVRRDSVQAFAWLSKAAAGGDARGQWSLGLLYENGAGVPRDVAQAVAWYRRSAEAGYAFAQEYLGDMYERGDGVIRSNVQAYKWFALAANTFGSGDAANRDRVTVKRDRATTQLDAAAVEEAKRLVAAWSPAGRSVVWPLMSAGPGERLVWRQPVGIWDVVAPASGRPDTTVKQMTPSGQGRVNWTDMIAVTTHVGRREQSLQAVVLDRPIQFGGGTCATATNVDLSQGKIAGFDYAMTVDSCPRRRAGGGELSMKLVIQGAEDLYIFERTGLGPEYRLIGTPNAEAESRGWIDDIRAIYLCNVRDPARACPAN